MKKLKILCLVLCLALAVFCCFTACGEEENTECIAHIDESGDKKCDNCGVELKADVPPDPPITDDPTDNGPETECTEHTDTDKNNKCDYCDADYTAECTAHTDTDKNHKCDYCDADYTAECTEHTDSDKNKKCDYCGSKYIKKCTEHVDVDKNHICDVCEENIITHTDVDKNHKCDYCGADYTAECADHTDINVVDHKCDYCSAEMASEHYDYICDHLCDLCGAYTYIGKHFCFDKDTDHICDYCNEEIVYDHIDEDKDHKCDTCGADCTVKCTEHIDVDENDKCDYCKKYCGENKNVLVANNKILDDVSYLVEFIEYPIHPESSYMESDALVPLVPVLEAFGAIAEEKDGGTIEITMNSATLVINKNDLSIIGPDGFDFTVPPSGGHIERKISDGEFIVNCQLIYFIIK